MTAPDPTRRRLVLALGSGLTLLAGCGDTDSATPEPAPPPETGTPGPGTAGPGPGEETPIGTETPQQGTGTPTPKDVVFPKPGGGEVSATIYGDGACGVVLVPQVDMDRQSWDQYARQLAASGYQPMAIDEGEEEKAAAVTAAVQYLLDQRGVERVVAVGASTGGEAVVRASAESPDAVDGVVAISPSGGTDVADDLSMPALFVVAEGDNESYVSAAEQLAAQAGENAELVTLEGEAHGQRLFESHGEALRSRLGDFFAEVCDPSNGE